MTDPTQDQPGALEALRRDHATRKRFLRLGGAGLAGGLTTLLAACGSSSEGGGSGGASGGKDSGETEAQSAPGPGLSVEQFGSGDVGIANYALTLEHVEAAFYADVLESGVLARRKTVVELVKRFGEQEREHVEVLTKLVRGAGGRPAKAPKTKFPLEDEQSVLQLAATVEDLGAAAYLGQATFIEDPQVLAAALSIHSVEARHAAALNDVLERPVAPDPFAEPADSRTVLAAVKPFLVSL